MPGVILTVACYTLSSLGDKQISQKLKCSPAEFAFIVSAASMMWLLFTIPFMGWGLTINVRNGVILLFLTGCKFLEFYTSAILLKSVSAYELKAWLGINIVISYLYNVVKGIYQWDFVVSLFFALLLVGIVLIMAGQRDLAEKGEGAGKKKLSKKKEMKLCSLFLLFIFSKLFYGMLIGRMTEGCKTTSVLFVVLLLTAVLQLPRIHIREVMEKKGIQGAVLTRIPNALGLILEAFVAAENLFFYAMIQPIQLALLFLVSLFKKEPMGKKKLAGSLICIASVVAVTLVIYQ